MQSGDLLALLILAAILIWIFKPRGRSSSRETVPAPSTVRPITTAQISNSADTSDVGPLTSSTSGGWILNPRSSFPLTIEGIDRQRAELFKGICEKKRYEGTEGLTQALLPLIARSNLHCREVDEYIQKFKPRYLNALQSLQRASKEWQEAAERDRQDLLPELRESALRTLDVRPDCDLIALLECAPQDATFDDALLDRYGMETLRFYLRYADDLTRVHVVPVENGDFRKSFEKLAEVGLAARGKDLPLQAVLGTLKLKDMAAMVSDLSPPKWTRKAQAIDYLLAVPDILDRTGKILAFRELFQIKPLPASFAQIDLAMLSSSWRHAEAVAWLIARTYIGGALYLRDVERDHAMKGRHIEMEWQQDRNPCPMCVQAATRQPSKKNRPKTPLHIGCRCWIHTDYDEDE